VRSLLWFHPAVWWLISRVQLARETVVDELSILTTNARRTYLDTLLAFADDTGLDMSPAFSARRHLVHRVMLLSREDGMSSRRIGAAACLLAVALCAGAWGAVSAFPLHETRQRALPPPPAPRESQPRDPLPPKAPRIPVTISFDNAELASVVRSFARIAGLDVAPDSDLRGRVTFEATEMAWYEALRQILEPHGLTFRVKDDTLSVVRLASPPPPPRGARVLEGLHPRRIGGDIRAPAKIKDVRPIYTPIAMRAGVQGVVIIETVIDEDGNVAQARVLRSLPLLDQAALDAVKDWKYEPTYVNGVPRAVIMAVTVDFNLR
jgi:TonB family protein